MKNRKIPHNIEMSNPLYKTGNITREQGTPGLIKTNFF